MSASRVCMMLLATIAMIGATSRPSRDDPPEYVATRTGTAIKIDGMLDDLAWRDAAWTEDFIDIEGTQRPVPPLRTRAKIAWDEANLYVAAEMAEPRVWATMTRRDEPLYKEQAFELFLDPGGDGLDYLELELNPLNTVCDLVMDKPYLKKGKADEAMTLSGLRTAVKVHGTIGDASDVDKGWSIEIAIPWASLKALGRDGSPPRQGEQWRVNLARMRRDAPDVKEPMPRGLWTWASQGAMNMHLPERWGSVTFSATTRPAK